MVDTVKAQEQYLKGLEFDSRYRHFFCWEIFFRIAWFILSVRKEYFFTKSPYS